MFKKYSSEYTAILATLLAPVVGTYFSDACAGEVSALAASGAVAGVSGLYLLIKRYQKGDVTVLGVRK